MSKLLNLVMGDFAEKKRYRESEKRAQALPSEYARAYNDIKQYLWNTSGILTTDPLVHLVELFEEASADGKSITEVVGSDVAAFADEFVSDDASYRNRQRQKLNKKFNKNSQVR